MRSFNTIIWFQGDTPTTPTTLLVDGEIPSSANERKDFFNFIFSGRVNEKVPLAKLRNRLLSSKDVAKFLPKSVSVTKREETTISSEHEWFIYSENFQTIRDKKRQSGESISPSLLCYEDNKGRILICSHFLNKDEAGRRVVFIFCAAKSNMTVACDLLKGCAEQLDKQCNEADLTFLKELSKRKENRGHNSFIAIILFLLTISFFFLWIKRISF